jgi:hypothetical protein
LPDVSVKLGRGGEMILNAIPNKNTEHIAALISKQKSSSKRFKSTGKNVSTITKSVHYRFPIELHVMQMFIDTVFSVKTDI